MKLSLVPTCTVLQHLVYRHICFHLAYAIHIAHKARLSYKIIQHSHPSKKRNNSFFLSILLVYRDDVARWQQKLSSYLQSFFILCYHWMMCETLPNQFSFILSSCPSGPSPQSSKNVRFNSASNKHCN